MTESRGVLAELKRRNVLRAGVLYIGAVWALSQGIAQLAPYVGAPDWVVRWFLVAACIGFPFWIAFAWFYAWTPEGFRRESQVAAKDSAAVATGHRLDFWIIGILVVAVVLLVTNQFVLHRDATSTANAADAKALAETLARVPEQSVAILPFANESGDPRQQYFSDGLSEELISDLTQLDGLKVIGKYSSFKFRDSKDSPAQIGAALGVAHLIQGSVFESAGQLRVVVSLIRARDGTSVWSHSYDQPLKNVFAIQSQIGNAVATALKVKLLGKPLVDETKPPSGNVQAYQLLLQGRALNRHNTEADQRQGIALIRQALKLDPDYAYAWGALANGLINLGQFELNGDAQRQQQAFAEARAAADREQALAPDSATTHVSRGYVLAQLDNDQMGALAQFRRALMLAPHDGVVMAFLANQYLVVGQLQPAVDLYRKAIATDPLRPDWYFNFGVPLMAQGRFDKAEQAYRETLRLQPGFPSADAALAEIAILRGDAAAARKLAGKISDPDLKLEVLAMAAHLDGDAGAADAALHAYVTKYGKADALGVAELYALRKQPDQMFDSLQGARAQNPALLATQLLSNPFLLRYKGDPRFATLCGQLGLPAPGKPSPGGSSAAADGTAAAE